MYDVMMCSVPIPGTSAPTPMTSTATLSQTHSHPESPHEGGRTTLGMIIALCIRRYYEIFDEVIDRTEAVPSWRTLGADSSTLENYVLGDGEEEEEDLDDEMLVMPIAMDQKIQSVQSTNHGPSSSSSPVPPTYNTAKKHRNTLSVGSNGASVSSRSMHNVTISTSSPKGHNGTVSSAAHPTNHRARSVISIEQGRNGTHGSPATLGKGSIAIGRETTRKGSGAAVEAISITAEGFFSAPNAPPVPKRPVFSTPPKDENRKEDDTDEEPRLTVAERRQLLERGL